MRFFKLLGENKSRYNLDMIHPARVFTVCAIIFLIFAAIFSTFPPTYPSNNWKNYVGQEIEHTYIINSEPQITGKSQSFLVTDLEGLIKGNISVYTGQLPLYKFGDVVKASGELKASDSNSGYSKSHQIVAILSYPKFYLANHSYKTPLQKIYYQGRRYLIGVKNAYVLKIGQILPEPQAGLLSGIIFGTKAELSSYVISLLAITGTVHIIALSGFNITVIAKGSSFVTKQLGRSAAFWVPTIGIVIFVLATGLSASVVRAAIMGILLLLAARLGRQSDALNGVLLAAVIMVALNPYVLLYDVGFQLSFAAVMGILFLAPVLEPYLAFFGKKLGPIMAGTFAAQIFSWPILAYSFGIVSIIGFLANALILPFIPAIMFVGFVISSVGFVSLWLARLLGVLLWFATTYILKVTEFLGNLRFASISMKFNDPYLVVAYFVLILELTYLLSVKKRKRDATQSV